MAAVCLLFVQTALGFFTQPLPGLQVIELREPPFGVQGLPTRSPAGWWSHGWLEPKEGPGACLGQLLLKSPGRDPYSATLLLAGTGLLDAPVSRCLSSAFGLTLHLTPDLVANFHGLPTL